MDQHTRFWFLYVLKLLLDTWVKVFRILRLTFHRKSALWKVSLKMLNSADNNSFSDDLITVYLKVFDHVT